MESVGLSCQKLVVFIFGPKIGQLTHLGSILGQNDLGMRKIFLEFNYGSFSKKMESVGLSCQKLTFDHIWA